MFLSKEYGSRKLQTKAETESWAPPHCRPSQHPVTAVWTGKGLLSVSELTALWRCSSVPSQRWGYSGSSHFQHPQPSNCHCWDPESSQIAMVTYPLMLWGSATAKHWPTDTWYSHLFFWKNKKHIICILMLMFKHILLI